MPRSSPGTAGIPQVIDILVIAVVGGLKRPIGPFIGALIYVLLSVFSSDILLAFGMSGERFKLVDRAWASWLSCSSPRMACSACGSAGGAHASEQPRSCGRATTGRRAMMRCPSPNALNAAGSGNALELRGVTRLFGALAALTGRHADRCARASGAPCSAPTAPARRRCSTASPATFRRPRARSASSART